MKILIEKYGNVIENIYCEREDIYVWVIDWKEVELAEAGDDSAMPDGRIRTKRLTEIPFYMLDALDKYTDWKRIVDDHPSPLDRPGWNQNNPNYQTGP